MLTIVAISAAVAFASVCMFFTALIAGMWYGAYRFLRENIKELFASHKTFREKLTKLASIIVLASIIIGLTAVNLYHWTRVGTVYRELKHECVCKN